MPRTPAKAPARRTTKRAARPKIGYDRSSSRRIPPQVDPDKPSLKETARIVKGSIVVKVNAAGFSSSFEPIEEPSVIATVTKLEVKEPSRATKHEDGTYTDPDGKEKFPYVNVEWTVNEGEPNQGRKLFSIWSLSPKALWRLKQDAVKLGVDPSIFEAPEGTDPEEFELDVEEEILPRIIGCSGILDLSTEEYETKDGKTRTKNIITDIQELTVGGRR